MSLKEKEETAWADVLRTYQGRWVMASILEACGWRSALCTHPQETFRQLGRQDIAKFIENQILTVDRKAVNMLELENLQREETERKEQGDDIYAG